MDEQLRRELLARSGEDQRIRTAVSPPSGEHTFRLPDELAAEWDRIDQDNTRWLGEVLDARGWPGRTLVGEDGAQAAWLLAQHADRDPARQRAFLQALRDAVESGEASPAHLAYLEDRVRVNAGQPQLYGTQFTVTEGEFGAWPIEDPARLDERRAAAGLEPFADYDARMRARLQRHDGQGRPGSMPAGAGEPGDGRADQGGLDEVVTAAHDYRAGPLADA